MSDFGVDLDCLPGMAVIQRRPTSLYTVPTSEHPVLTVSITQNRTKFVTRRAREETWTTKKGCGFFRDQPQLARPPHTDHASKKITYLGAIAAPSHRYEICACLTTCREYPLY